MKHPILLLLIFWGFLSSGLAQQDVFTNHIYTQNKLSQTSLESFIAQQSFQGKAYAYFRFSAIPGNDEMKLATDAGIKFLEYIPENIYLISFPANNTGLNYLLHQSSVTAQLIFENEKFSDQVIRRYNNFINASKNKVVLYVYTYDDINIESFKAALSQWGEVLTASDVFHRVALSIALDKVKAMSELSAVKIIDAKPMQPAIINLPGKTNHRSTAIGSVTGRNLQGDSVIMGEWDGAGVGAHVDIDTPRITRFMAFTNNLNGQHATHVCGTMAGKGNIDPYATGMAPNATVFSWDFMGDIIAQMDSGVRFQNVMITQNSYAYGDADDSCYFRGRYDDVSHDLDVLVRNHPGLIHMYAAGNSQSLCGLGGYRTVFSGFQSAKNIISVGALTSQDAMSSFSSWGPVRDGRLKPEVCAVGVSVYSTQDQNLYAGGWNGTSMATPGASGTMAQLVQRYRQLHSGNNPIASLMRAIYCNTADDILNAGPDFKSGFGRINGLTAVKAIEQNRYVVDSITNGSFKVDSIFVTLGTNQIKVTLAWSDKEAAILASKALVNDLDLYVITPINDTVRPWVLDTLNRNNLAVHGIDSVNNIEQVTIDAPIQGYYKIYVKGRSVPFGPQVYAYAYERVAKAVTVVYPNGDEKLAPSATYTIKWDANGVSSTCNIDYSLNNGTTWTSLATGVTTSLKNYNWTTPNTNTSLARIRITAGAYSDISDSTFSILPVIDSIKGLVCDKQVTLKWRRIATATAYNVMQLIGGNMQSVGTTTDTFYTVRNLTNNVAYWFTVRGKYNNAFSERAYAVSFTPTNTILPPTITLQPSLNAVCSSTLVTLKSKATGTAPILEQWQLSVDSGKTFSNITGATDTVLSFVAITAMNGLKVRAFFYNSCQNFQYTDTVTVVVDTLISFSQQPQNITICNGGNAFFKAKALSTSPSGYRWQYNDGINGWLTIPGATDTLLNLVGVGYSQNGWGYRMLASNKCDTGRSSTVAILTVTAPLKVTALGGKTICYGTGTAISATTTGGDTSRYIYRWSLNGSLLQSSHSPLLSVAPLTTQTYSVLLWDSCSSVADSDVVTITVLTPLAISSTSQLMICKGNSISLSATTTGGNGNYTYVWMQGSSMIQFGKSASVLVTPSTTTTYKVFVTDSCTPKNDTATVTVTVRQPLHVTWKSTPDTVCIGATATINAIASGGDSTYTYTFINANTNTVLKTGLASFLTAVINPNNYYRIVISDSCTNLNDSVSFRIPMRNKLSLTLTKTPANAVCAGEPVLLEVNPMGGALKNYNYQWRESGSSTIIGSGKQITVTPSATTTYVATLNDGCTVANAKDSITVNIDVPNPLFTKNYNTGSDYAYYYPAQSGYKSYFWNFGDGDTTSEFQPNHRYKLRGDYTVCLTVTTFNNCDSQYCDTVHVFFNNGIKGNQANRFSYSPNPFGNELQLQFDQNLPLSISLYDALGRAIDISPEIQKTTLLKTDGLASGAYLLKLTFKNEVSYVKLIHE